MDTLICHVYISNIKFSVLCINSVNKMPSNTGTKEPVQWHLPAITICNQLSINGDYFFIFYTLFSLCFDALYTIAAVSACR